MPEDDADPSDEDIEALVAWYRCRQRTPRLEYVPQAAPRLEPALIAAGFHVEGRLPLMVFDRDRQVSVSNPDAVWIRPPASDEDTFEMMKVQAEAMEDRARLMRTSADNARLLNVEAGSSSPRTATRVQSSVPGPPLRSCRG